jgi:hypothetical protein
MQRQENIGHQNNFNFFFFLNLLFYYASCNYMLTKNAKYKMKLNFPRGGLYCFIIEVKD